MDTAKGQFLTKNIRIVLILLGVGGLVLKHRYDGPLQEVVWAHGGNVAVSFSVYFLMTFLPVTSRSRKMLSAGLALGVVQLFELTDGLGVMSNVFDALDLAANALGIGLALAVDMALNPIGRLRAIESGQK